MTEKVVVKKQIEARRAARRAERAAANRVGAQAAIVEEDVDEDAEGLVWEEKGTWLFYLELGTGKTY